MSMVIPFANAIGPNSGAAADGVLFGVAPQVAVTPGTPITVTVGVGGARLTKRPAI